MLTLEVEVKEFAGPALAIEWTQGQPGLHDSVLKSKKIFWKDSTIAVTKLMLWVNKLLCIWLMIIIVLSLMWPSESCTNVYYFENGRNMCYAGMINDLQYLKNLILLILYGTDCWTPIIWVMTFWCRKDHNFCLKLYLSLCHLTAPAQSMSCSTRGPFHLLFLVHVFSPDIVRTPSSAPF